MSPSKSASGRFRCNAIKFAAKRPLLGIPTIKPTSLGTVERDLLIVSLRSLILR
jgi:hypothetical protein